MLPSVMPQLHEDLFGREQLLLMLDGLLPVPVRETASVREAAELAIRNYASAERLAGNRLARGGSAPERVAYLRALVDDAVEAVFGTSYADAALREVVVAGYLVAAMPHEGVASQLHLSRSTYFRRLAEGLRRLTDHLAAADHALPKRASSR